MRLPGYIFIWEQIILVLYVQLAACWRGLNPPPLLTVPLPANNKVQYKKNNNNIADMYAQTLAIFGLHF